MKLEVTAIENGNTIALELTDQFFFIRDHECILITLSSLRWPALRAAVLELIAQEEAAA